MNYCNHFLRSFIVTVFLLKLAAVQMFQQSLNHRLFSRNIPSFRLPNPVSYHYRHRLQQSSHSTTQDPSLKPQLTLLEEEKQFFDILKCVVHDHHLNTTIRVAGGWVRDRLLKKPTKYDIDLAIDNLTGVQFIEELNLWMKQHGKNVYKFSIIQLNPEKSKHLETVQLTYGRLQVDVVNLRTESYSKNSRIPKIAMGTPMEDAYRRDLTINSLFYNIHTNEVEDFTGQGLNDLMEQKIQTPLPPFVTFTDDPLRALRAIRFACRFNFTIVPELLDASSDPLVRKALEEKVSRERIRNEIDLLLATPAYHRGIYLFYSTKILESCLPTLVDLNEMYGLIHCFDVMKEVTEDETRSFYVKGIFSTLLLHLSQFIPRYKSPNQNAFESNLFQAEVKALLQVPQSSVSMFLLLTMEAHDWITSKKPKLSASVVALQDGIRLSNKESSAISKVISSLSSMDRLLEKLSSSNNAETTTSAFDSTVAPSNSYFEEQLQSPHYGPLSRLEIGLVGTEIGELFSLTAMVASFRRIIRTMILKYGWNIEQFESIIDQIAERLHIKKDGQLFPSDLSVTFENSSEQLKTLFEEAAREIDGVNRLFVAMQDLNLKEIAKLTPLFNGTELMKLLNIPQNKGKMIGELLDLEKKWMICHPEGTKTELEYFLHQYYLSRVSERRE